jgi:hypothetical protein
MQTFTSSLVTTAGRGKSTRALLAAHILFVIPLSCRKNGSIRNITMESAMTDQPLGRATDGGKMHSFRHIAALGSISCGKPTRNRTIARHAAGTFARTPGILHEATVRRRAHGTVQPGEILLQRSLCGACHHHTGDEDHCKQQGLTHSQPSSVAVQATWHWRTRQ